MSIPKRLVIVAAIMAMFCLWIAFVYVDGRSHEWLFAAGYSVFVLLSLIVVVFCEEILRLMK